MRKNEWIIIRDIFANYMGYQQIFSKSNRKKHKILTNLWISSVKLLIVWITLCITVDFVEKCVEISCNNKQAVNKTVEKEYRVYLNVENRKRRSYQVLKPWIGSPLKGISYYSSKYSH